MIKRATAVTLWFFMLFLSVERADLACARHSEDPRPAHAAMQHEHATSAADLRDVAKESDSCSTPVQRDCCQALMTCSVVLDLERSADVGVISRADGIVSASATAPASRTAAPEPPPPRA